MDIILFVFVVLLGVALLAVVSLYIVIFAARIVLSIAHRIVREQHNKNRPW